MDSDSRNSAQGTGAGRGASASPAFDSVDVMVPMRDGVRLHTTIFTPKGASADLPIIFARTPYGIAGASRAFGSSYAELAADGYIFALQDIRGRYTSEGQFVMLRPMRNKKDKKAIDESTDAYDTIDWMLKKVPHNNGRVGMMGTSYPGWLTVIAMLDPHPALKAVSPQASPADMFIGDDFHHNGAFRLSYGFEYATMMETNKERAAFTFDDPDTYAWYLKLGSLATINMRYLHEQIPSWNNFAFHASYDAFWQRQAIKPYVDRVTVPTLSVSGWWDQEDFYGAITIYELLEKYDKNHLNYLVVGPWNHGGWSGASGQKLGPVDFGFATSPDYRKTILAPWFAYWLKDQGKLDLPEATTFETGTNKWVRRDSWPPKTGVTTKRLYTQAQGGLSFEHPSGARTRAFEFVGVGSGRTQYPVSPTAHSADLLARLELGAVAGRRSAFSQEPPGRQELADAAAHRGRGHRRQHHGAPLRVDHRVRRRLDREADRRLSRPVGRRYVDGRLPAHGGERRLPRAVSKGIRHAGGDHAQPRRRVHRRPPYAGLPLQKRTPDHGAGPEHVVSGHRPKPADVRRQHLRRQGRGLQSGNASHLPRDRCRDVRRSLSRGDAMSRMSRMSRMSISRTASVSRAFVLCASVCAIAAVPTIGTAQSPSPDWAAFDRYVAKAASDWHVPALAIAVVHDDSVVFARGYGVLETGKPTRADEHTRFAIGSTTKAMTSAGLAMLVDEGKLHFDDRVTDYIPELQLYDPYASHELTIRDLLTHRTGMPATDLFWTRFDYPITEVIHRLRYIKPQSSFRSEWEYQNVMYSLNGLIIERVSGMPWDAFVRSRIFGPLGMTETEPLVSSIRGKSNVAVPHVLAGDSVRVVPIRSTDRVASAGSVWSSVSDMSKWMRFVLDSGRVGNKRLIAANTFRELITPQIRAPFEEYPALELAKSHSFSYGLGWFIQDYRGQSMWMHTGSIDGMCAIIGLLPDKRTGVYILENLDHAELRHALMYSALDLYLGGPSRDWSADVHALFDKLRREATTTAAAGASAPRVETHPSLPLERYVGTFVDSAYGTIQVTLVNGTLRARIGNEPAADLAPLAYETFRTTPVPPVPASALTFVPDGAGRVSGVRMSGVVFERKRG